jgi:hypothetical protein
MSIYTFDFSNEKPPQSFSSIFPEGENTCIIFDADMKRSAKGNDYLAVVMQNEQGDEQLFPFMTQEGKRWHLKRLLEVTKVGKVLPEQKQGRITFVVGDLIGKKVKILIRHKLDKYFDSHNEPQERTKAFMAKILDTEQDDKDDVKYRFKGKK